MLKESEAAKTSKVIGLDEIEARPCWGGKEGNAEQTRAKERRA